MTQHPTCGYNNLALLEFHACTGEPSLRYFMNPSVFVSQLAQCSVLLTLADALQQEQSYQSSSLAIFPLPEKQQSSMWQRISLQHFC